MLSARESTARGAAAGFWTPRAFVWLGPLAGFSLALLMAAAAIAGEGLGQGGLDLGLRLTARVAFVAFWPSYAAGALVVLFGPALQALQRQARTLGLTFAAVMAVHFGLVLGRCAIGAPPAERTIILFAPGAICAVILTLASWRPVSRGIGPRGWRLLRNVAMNYIMLDFAIDFVRRQSLTSAAAMFEYLPFAALAVAGPGLRLAAHLKRRRSALSRFE